MSGSVDECIKDGIVSIDQVLTDHQTTAKSTIHTNVPSPFDLYAGSATPYTTTSSDSSHPTSSSSSSSEDVGDGVIVEEEEEEDDDEGGGVGKRAFFCRSTVELDPDEVPLMLPYEFVEANVARKELGEIRGMVNGRAVVQSRGPLVDLDTPVCLREGRVVGLVEEVIGPVKSASYCVRLVASFREELKMATTNTASTTLYYPLTNTKYVFPEALMDRGCDASTLHDTEVAAEEREFSDDEEERRVAAERKQAKKKNFPPTTTTATTTTTTARVPSSQSKKPRFDAPPKQRVYAAPPAMPGVNMPNLGGGPHFAAPPAVQGVQHQQQQQQQQQWQQQWSQYAAYQMQQPVPVPSFPGGGAGFPVPPSFAQQQQEIQRTQSYLAQLYQQQQQLYVQQQQQQQPAPHLYFPYQSSPSAPPPPPASRK